MSDSYGVVAPAPMPRRGWAERPEPWWSEAFAASGAVLAGGGLVALGFDISQNWATALIGIYIAVAYLVEPFLPRTGQAACTTVAALGTPTFVALIVLPAHTYNGFRVLQLGTILLWFAFFLVGGTRGRMVLLALAVTFVWVFVTLEVGHVQDTARYFNPFRITPSLVSPVGRSGGSESCRLLPDGSEQCTTNDFGTSGGPTFPPGDGFSSRPKSIGDYSLGIGLESLAFGVAFVLGISRGERRGRRGIATAYAIPAVLSLSVAVAALGNKADHVWITGLLALVAGVLVGAAANGRRRFFTWTGAIASAVGVALIAGDIADSLSGDYSHRARDFGLSFFLFGLATMFAAVVMARVLGEREATATSS